MKDHISVYEPILDDIGDVLNEKINRVRELFEVSKLSNPPGSPMPSKLRKELKELKTLAKAHEDTRQGLKKDIIDFMIDEQGLTAEEAEIKFNKISDE